VPHASVATRVGRDVPGLASPALIRGDARSPRMRRRGRGSTGVRIGSILHPIARDLLVETFELADRERAARSLSSLTPGGLLTSTREMTTAVLGARTPVVVWVAPEGAQAASAGFFLLMAADFAVMAPATNTGAAHPVGGQGETIEGILGKKVEEDAAANVRALAARRGRDVALAEKAVLESRSFTAGAKEKLIDLSPPTSGASPGSRGSSSTSRPASGAG
jgi:membrane-bound serine protease (ClpP class)